MARKAGVPSRVRVHAEKRAVPGSHVHPLALQVVDRAEQVLSVLERQHSPVEKTLIDFSLLAHDEAEEQTRSE